MAKAYLTIDDSPTEATKPLLDGLERRGMQALFFCRGDRIENDLYGVVNVIKAGHIVGNHSYDHKPSSKQSFDEWVEDIERTEALISEAYFRSSTERPGKYYRFPYMDRGDGVRLERIWPELVKGIASGDGYAWAEDDEVKKRQTYLRDQGFTQPYASLNHPLYRTVSSIANAADTLLTDTTQDWKLLARHQEKEQVSIDDLKAQLREDPFIMQGVYEHATLLHDDAEILHKVLELIDFMRDGLGYEFQRLDL